MRTTIAPSDRSDASWDRGWTSVVSGFSRTVIVLDHSLLWGIHSG